MVPQPPLPAPPKGRPLIPVRLIITLMTILCPIVCYMGRQNLNFTIVAMVPCKSNQTTTTTTSTTIFPSDSTTTTPLGPPPGVAQHANATTPVAGDDCPETFGPKYDWSEDACNWVMAAFFYFYVVAQIPGGRLAEIVGPVWVLLFTTVGTAAASVVSPLAASVGSLFFIFVRFSLGIFQASLYPACYIVCTRWLPPSERRLALPILNVSAYIGAMIASETTGYFMSRPNLGWEWAFYLPSMTAALWAATWFGVASDTPSKHDLISQSELDYIESSMEQHASKSDSSAKISWLKAFCSRQVIMTVILQITSGWSFTLILQFIPSYLNYILKVEISENSSINTTIYLIFCIAAPMVGYVSARLVNMKTTLGLRTITIRKIFQSVSIFGQAICFIWLTKVGQDQSMAKIVLYLQILAYSFVNGCECHLANEISYQYAGSIYAIGNALGSSTGFLIPGVKSFIIQDSTDKASWDNFFYLASGISLAGGLVFLVWGGNEPEDFSQLLVGKTQGNITKDIGYPLEDGASYTVGNNKRNLSSQHHQLGSIGDENERFSYQKKVYQSINGQESCTKM